MSRKKIVFYLILAGVAALTAAFSIRAYLRRARREIPPSIEMIQQEEGYPVTVALPREKTLEKTLEVDGTVTAARRAEITPRIEQIIRKINVDVGDLVERGELLVELESETIEAAREARRTARDEAEMNLRRAESLFASGAIPRQQLDQARSAAETARAHYLESRQAFDDTRITAPFSGLISRRFQEPGELSSKVRPVLALVSLDELELHCPVSEIAILGVRSGMKARVELDAYPGEILDSAVKTISPTAEEISRLFQVKLTLPDGIDWLRPGMYGRGVIVTGSIPDAMVIPQEALIDNDDGEAGVYRVCDEEDRALFQKVETGLARDGEVQIISGLDYECPVVIRGQERLSHGVRVQVVE